MSSTKDRARSKSDRPLQKFAQPESSGAPDRILCKACNKEYGMEEYYDHVYDADECYTTYLASEKKEMSKQ